MVAVLEVAPGEGALGEFLDDGGPVFLVERGDAEFGHGAVEEVEAGGPAPDLAVPVFELEGAVGDLGGEEGGGLGGVDGGGVAAALFLEDEAAEGFAAGGEDAAAEVVVEGGGFLADFAGEEFVEPFLRDGGAPGEADGALAALDLDEVGGEEKGGVLGGGLGIELAVPPAGEEAEEAAVVAPDGEAVREGEEKGAGGEGKVWIVDFIVYILAGRLRVAATGGEEAEVLLAGVVGFAGGAGEDAEGVALGGAEVHGAGGLEGVPFGGEVAGVVFFGEARPLGAGVAFFEEAFALQGGGDEGGFGGGSRGRVRRGGGGRGEGGRGSGPWPRRGG